MVYCTQFSRMFLNYYESFVTEILANIDEDILSVSIFMDDMLKKLLESMFTGVLISP